MLFVKRNYLQTMFHFTLILICITLSLDCRRHCRGCWDKGMGMSSMHDASFYAVLKKIPNAPVPDSVSGTAELIILGNNLTIRVKAKGLTPGEHPMHLHAKTDGTQSECPTMKSDFNGDGYLDHVEADSGSGLIHIPLTNDPLDFSSMSFPHANNEGVLFYETTVPLDKLKNSIMSKESKAVFNPGNYDIELHGCDPSVKLPASIATMNGMPAYLTIPVLCGRLVKINQK